MNELLDRIFYFINNEVRSARIPFGIIVGDARGGKTSAMRTLLNRMRKEDYKLLDLEENPELIDNFMKEVEKLAKCKKIKNKPSLLVIDHFNWFLLFSKFSGNNAKSVIKKIRYFARSINLPTVMILTRTNYIEEVLKDLKREDPSIKILYL